MRILSSIVLCVLTRRIVLPRRNAGRQTTHVRLAIDDHSRLAYSEILPDEKRGSCLGFLFNTLRFFQSLGVKVQGDDRQRLKLSIPPLRQGADPAQDQASVHQALHAQSGAFHERPIRGIR